MIQRMLTSALAAGLAAGLLAALLQFAFLQKILQMGEAYESGALVHFEGVLPGPLAHDLADTVAANGHEDDLAPELVSATGNLGRNALSIVFEVLVYSGYALVLVAGFGLAEHFGIQTAPRQALLWGIAGFVAVQLAPAMGLPPELPGTPGADLVARQVWWVGTVISTALGLAMLAFGQGPVRVAAIIFVAAPHVIGAPEPAVYAGVVPPELASAFAARTLGVGLAVWTVLGWFAGWIWSDKRG